MTRTGTSKAVDAAYAIGRLQKAMAFQEIALIALENMGRVRDPDAVSSNTVLAVIAYTDAITAAYGRRVNQKDHAAAAKLLRDVLGKALPDAQERRLARLLGHKDEMQYGARTGRPQDAEQRVEQMEEFGVWARSMLAVRGISLPPIKPDETGG